MRFLLLSFLGGCSAILAASRDADPTKLETGRALAEAGRAPVPGMDVPDIGRFLEAGGQQHAVFACADGREGAGVMPMAPGAGAPPHGLRYVAVDDVDATTARVVELGGATHCPPTDIAGLGRFRVNADPPGAGFALFRSVHA